MAQQINVNLAFTADTARARSQLMELSQSLDSLLKGSAKSQELPITKELFEAQTAASSLKVALNEAVNVKTGKLDLLKFNDSLTKSGLTITELRHQLEALGPGGSAAFLSLSKSIMTAEVPIKRTSKMVNELWENLKKTAGWQISSSVIHGFMGSIQQAVGYAKDLNESLTDIRIVTGASIDEMAKFAEQANKSAKALSTTTTEYTKASLIYYQQGLSDAEVKERTDVTIKMANAAGSSAETVSQQMTAVWNNFDDGSKSLEYYADVMTALGAATASSTDEISAGLNKFASVASTVGLSYEYATAALATVTSTTRESADTVGTAFKTLFARIQGLQLGETLDDGTTLNKYSEALYKIGIDIKDTNGEMKDMNTILNEMGSKWQDLSKDQQLATAQTVAGVRQYTQLIALMDNWDFFEQNLAVAQGAEGTLQEQADIYAEGWEAARDRVRAATEDLFDSLLDSDFFIGFLNVIEDITSGVANLVDSFGGMPGAIALVGVAFTKVFNKQLVGMVDNLAYGFKSLTGANLKTAKDLREETSKAAIDVSAGDVSTQGGVQAQILQGQLSVQKMLIDGENQLGEAEKARVQQLLDINQMYADQALNAAKVADKNKEIVQDQAKQIRRKVTTGKEGQAPKITTKDFAEAQQKAVDLAKTSASVQQKISSLQKSIAAGDSSKKFTKQIKEITQELSVLDDKMGTTSKASQEFQKLLEILNTKGNGKGIKDFGKQLSGEGRDDKFDFITDLGDETNAVLKDIFKNIQDAYGENGAQVIDEFVVSLEKLGLAVVKSETALEGQEQHLNNIKTYIDGAKGAMTTFAESVVKGVQGASQMAMGLMSVKSAFEAIGNADMSFGDKLSSVLMSLAMGIPMVVNGFKMLKEAIGESGKKALLATAENIGLAASHGALAAGSATATTSIWAQAAAWLGLETAMAPVLLGLTLIVAAIAAVALIGWGLVAAFQAIKANSPEGKLAAAKEEAKALKGSLEDATTAANDLKSAFDGYDSVVAELDKCTRGTDEWAAALMNVNNSVLDLMSEYPELATMTKTVDGKVQKAVYKDEDTGALTIRDWAKENMQQQANAAVIANQGAYFEAQTKVREAQIIIDQKSIRDDLLQSVMGGPAIYNQEGAQADVNQITDLIMKNVDQFTDSGDVLDTLSNILKTAGFDAPEDALTSLAGTITESMGAFGDLNAAIAANVAAQQAQNDAIAASVLANKDYVKESKFQDEILSASGDTYETLLKEQKKKLEDDKWGKEGIWKPSTEHNEKAKEIFKEYADAAGLDLSKITLTGVTGMDNNRKFVYQDQQGNEQKVDLEVMRNVVAAANAQQALGDSAKQLAETFGYLSRSGEEAGQALIDFIADKNLADSSYKEFQDIKEKGIATVSKTETGEISGVKINQEELASMMGFDTIDEAAKAAGYESADKFIEAFSNAIKQNEIAWDEISLPDGFKELDNLSLSAAQSFEESFTTMGEEGIVALGDALKKGMKGLKDSDKTSLLNQIANIDWSNWDAVQQMSDIFESFGVTLEDIQGIDLSSLAETMRQAGHATPVEEIKQLREDMEALIGLTSELEIGSVISKEDYDLLVSYNAELERYFVLTADGKYKVVGGLGEIQDLNLDEKIQQMQEFQEIANKMRFDEWTETNAAGEKQQVNWDAYANGLKTDNQMVGTLEAIREFMSPEDLSALGFEESYLDSIVEAMENGSPEAQEKARQMLTDFYSKLNDFRKEAESGTFDDSEINKMVGASAKSFEELSKMDLKTKDLDAYQNGLKNLASQYDSCRDELEELIDVQKKYKKDSKEVINAQKKLEKALKKAEWDKFTEGALDAARALNKATEDKDIKKNLGKIQKSFKEAFNMDVSIEELEKFKDDFVDWGKASEEESDDIATKIKSLINFDRFVEEANIPEEGMTIPVEIEDSGVYNAFAGIEGGFNTVRSIIEGNPPTVTATGDADFSGMISAMVAAGATAADVAMALKMIGQTQVDFSAWGEGLGEYDFNDPESFMQFTKDIANWSAQVTSSGDASFADAVATAFPGGKIPATTGSGGGRHSGGGGGGGGGGGKGKEKKPKKAKEVKKTDIVERYHEINDLLDDAAEKMEDASEIADRLYGNARLEQMDKVNDLLREEIKLTQQKKEEAKKYLQEDKQALQQAAEKAGISFQFDSEGNISNYTDQMTKLYNELKGAIDSANADGDADEDEQERIDKIQEKVDAVKDAIDQYDETRELIEDLDNDIQDKLYEIYDNELEAIEYKVDLQLEVSEADLEVLDYYLEKIDDDAFKAAESIALLNKKAENLYDQVKINEKALEEVFGLSASEISMKIFGDDETLTQEQADLMKDYRDNLLDLNEQFDEIRETVESKVMDVFDAWNEKLQDGADVLDHYGSVLDSYKNIIDIVGKDTLGLSNEFMTGLEDASIENAMDKMESTKSIYEAMVAAQANAERALEEARANGDEASIKMWEDTLKSITEEAQSAQEDMLSAWEDTLDLVASQFEATVERVVESFNESVYAMGGLEGLSEEFARQKEMGDVMVDDYQKIYELSKLTRNINKTLDDTHVIAGKQKLKKLLGDINKLQEDGVEMSKYDLEYLQREYDLRMAEIELENAQAKKDTVRLSKDNEGNWSYVYTTSVDAVDAAQQKYEDALYAMQELSSNYVDEMSENLISTSQEMAEALANLRASDFNSYEDYEAEVERVRKQYEEKLAQQEKELNKAIGNNKKLYDEDWTNYHNATGYKISDTEEFVTKFKDSMLGALMDSESDTANFNEIMRSSVDILANGLMEAAQQYYTRLEEVMQQAGTSTGGFAEDMQENIDKVSDASEQGTEAVNDMAGQMTEAFGKITDTVSAWQENYGLAMQDIIESNMAVIESFNQMLKELSIDPDAITVKYDIKTDYGIPDEVASLDSGGYTGSWGKEGKLAILHEQEMVLNKEQTANVFNMANKVGEILNTIELNARQASVGMGNLTATVIRDDNNQVLEQQVSIVAEFPNVNDKSEIEEAFNNLINTASQYANRK